MQIRTAQLIVHIVDGRRFVALNVCSLLGIALYPHTCAIRATIHTKYPVRMVDNIGEFPDLEFQGSRCALGPHIFFVRESGAYGGRRTLIHEFRFLSKFTKPICQRAGRCTEVSSGANRRNLRLRFASKHRAFV